MYGFNLECREIRLGPYSPAPKCVLYKTFLFSSEFNETWWSSSDRWSTITSPSLKQKLLYRTQLTDDPSVNSSVVHEDYDEGWFLAIWSKAAL